MTSNKEKNLKRERERDLTYAIKYFKIIVP